MRRDPDERIRAGSCVLRTATMFCAGAMAARSEPAVSARELAALTLAPDVVAEQIRFVRPEGLTRVLNAARRVRWEIPAAAPITTICTRSMLMAVACVN